MPIRKEGPANKPDYINRHINSKKSKDDKYIHMLIILGRRDYNVGSA